MLNIASTYAAVWNNGQAYWIPSRRSLKYNDTSNQSTRDYG